MLNITNREHFNLQRKIVANMTTESWQNIPHVSYNYEADVTSILKEINKINSSRDKNMKITVNTLMLKIIAEGLKSSPAMNARIEYNRGLVRGRIDTIKEINMSIPMVMPTGEMMTVNVRGFDHMNLDDITEKMADIRRKSENTILNEAMYEASLYNTFMELRHGKVMKAVGRLIGSKTGRHKITTLKGEEKERYYSIPEKDRLTGFDIEQGTITVSNLGSLDPRLTGNVSLLEIIPPQVTAIGLGAVQEKYVPVSDDMGKTTMELRRILPMCIAFDHRALDFSDIIPFINRCDEILTNPHIIHEWIDKDTFNTMIKDA